MPYPMEVDLPSIAAALDAEGFMLRGGFAFLPDEVAPPGLSGGAARAVVLVGSAGGSIWPRFEAWRAAHPDAADPLDTWSRRVIGTVAERCGARAVSPSDRPYLPFQQWAMRAEGLKPSPLGILMHPVYGLWHAYRGALLFDDVPAGIDAAQANAHVHPCDICVEKRCLKSCPVNAHTLQEFAYGACLDHIRSTQGRACMEQGCLDRNACPNGAAYRYPAAMQAFHMTAFRG